MPISLEEFAQRLTESSLIAREELDAVLAASSLGGDPAKDAERLARELVRLRKLTAFQAQQIYAGKGKSLLLGNYLLLEKLGQGGMGMVLKAEHRRMKRLVALKILSPAVVKSDEAVKRFQREVEAAAKLIHPNIVTAFDADEANGTHFLVMEFVPGRDLSSIVAADGPLTISLAVDCLRQAARGLAFAHQKGIVHRDIKPANLLLDSQGTIKILDMGLARIDGIQPLDAKDGLTQSGQVMGTVDYMAPEQAFDVKHADGRADIYSLGCTLFRLLTKTNLYEGETLVQKLMAHQQQPIPSLVERRPEVPMELEAVFRKMVAKKPEERYQTMAEVEAALGSVATVHFAGQSNQPPASTADPNKSPGLAATATLASPAADGYAPTISLTNPLQSTDPVSDFSIQVARQQTSQLVAQPTRPWWKQPAILVVGIATLALISLGIWLIVNQEKTPMAAIPVSDGGTAKIAGTGWHGWPADAPPPAIAPFKADQARKHQDEWAAYLGTERVRPNSLGMQMALIPPGEFLMGSSDADVALALKIADETKMDSLGVQRIHTECPQHLVRITKPFRLGIHEVTVGQFGKFIEQSGYKTQAEEFGGTSSITKVDAPGIRPANRMVNWRTPGHEVDENSPVSQVSWNDAAAFCNWLSEQENLEPSYVRDGNSWTLVAQPPGYRLPTEAEWEYACRAGTTTQYSFGDDWKEFDKFGMSSATGRPLSVGTLSANPFGLYDMHGNITEWCIDWHDHKWYERSPTDDPRGANGGLSRVVRSKCGPGYGRSASRIYQGSAHRDGRQGFRAALSGDSVKTTIAERAKAANVGWHGWPADAPPPAIAPFKADQARKHQDTWAEYLKVPREWENIRGMKFVLIPPGEFTMGSSSEEVARWRSSIVKDGRSHEELESEMPAHKVILTEPFYLGVHEVTQNVYAKLMDYNPSSFAKNGPKLELVARIANRDTAEHPVETVSWTEGLEFCRRLSREEQLIPFDFQTGARTANQRPIGYRLPTEAQWEFACRAGTTASWSVSSAEVSSVAWFAINSSQHSQIVGKRQANPFGLYDMHGNVSEWVLDAWEPNYYSRFEKQAAINPFNASGGDNWRVFRGGNWSHASAAYCRSAGRSANVSLARGSGIGFRVALPVEAVRDLLKKTASEKPANNSGNFALELDGTTAWVQLPLLDEREGPLTIEAYVQPAEKLNRMATIGAAFVAPRGVGMTIFENKLEAAMSFVDEPTWSTAKTPQRPDSKVMSHVAAVFDGRTLKVFLNGKLSGQSELPLPHRPSRGPFALGGFEGRDLFAGQIDEVRFSKSARYIQDFSPKPRFDPDADTLVLYHCDEGRGDELRDSSENGLHGKIIGANWVPVTGN